MASIYEDLGYGKADPKPHCTTHAVVKTTQGWIVLRLYIKGVGLASVEQVYGPAVRSLAVEQYKLLTARNLIEVLNEG